jgi:hypothetical protein
LTAWDINIGALPAGVQAAPASGSLDAEQSQLVTLNGDTANTSFTVAISSNGRNVNVTINSMAASVAVHWRGPFLLTG